jgi:hypothetical protein
VSDISRQKVELLGWHIGNHSRQDVDPPPQRRRQWLIEVALEGADPVLAGTRYGRRTISVAATSARKTEPRTAATAPPR